MTLRAPRPRLDAVRPLRGARTTRAGLLAACALAAVLPVLGGSPAYKDCPEDTQTCLNHMVTKLKGQGWLGIWMDDSQAPRVLKVIRVIPGSPAESAGFKTGDVLVSVNGARFSANSEARCITCDATKEIWKPGTRLDYTVRRKRKTVKLHPTLATLPSDVMAQMIGMHMLEHLGPEEAPRDGRTSEK